jgi:hypothetical protein
MKSKYKQSKAAPRILTMDEFVKIGNTPFRNLAGIIEALCFWMIDTKEKYGLSDVIYELVYKNGGSILIHSVDTILRLDTFTVCKLFYIKPDIENKSDGCLRINRIALRKLILNPRVRIIENQTGTFEICNNVFDGVHIEVIIEG